MKNKIKFLSLFILGIALLSCQQKQQPVTLHKIEGKTMGEFYHISYVGEEIQGIKDTVEAFLKYFNAQVNTYDSNSNLSQINNNQTDVMLPLTQALLEKGRSLYKLSQGAFDPTIAPLVDAWGFGLKNAENMDSAKVDSLLAFVGFDKVKFEGNRLIKSNPNIRFNVNAYAPGYAADLIADIFNGKNYKNYMIEIGGEVVASGLNAKNELWLIGIERPEDNLTTEKNELVSGIKLKDKGLATSGNYRRFYKKEGKKYAHTIDPKSGFPVQHSLLSATVLTTKAVDADAYATICMVLGKDEAIALFGRDAEVAFYLIYADSNGDMQEYVSENLKDSFSSFQ